MGIDINKFEAAKNKARKLIHEDAKQDAHIIKERMADRNNSKFFRDQPNDSFVSMSSAQINENDNEYGEMYSAMDSKMNQFLESRKTANNSSNGISVISRPTKKKKSLQKEILE